MQRQNDASARLALIINGDDFGYSEAVNLGVLRGHREGVLTSASLMVNEAASEHAVEIARSNPQLSVGLHLSLVLGRAALSQAEIPHLVNESGEFSRSPFLAGLNYFFNRQARRELHHEMRRQFEKFAATGLRFSHVDGHNHLHMHPVVFDELIKLCEEFDVRRVRVVKNEASVHFQITRRRWPSRLLLGSIFGLLGRSCTRRLEGRGFVFPGNVYGLLQSGELTEGYLVELLGRMGGDNSEIYLHPSAAAADPRNPNENPGGQVELEALLAPRLRQAIEQNGFRLATYETLRGSIKVDRAC